MGRESRRAGGRAGGKFAADLHHGWETDVTLKELCDGVNKALNEQPDALRMKQLAQSAAEIGALTGWAPGIIDPHGRFAKICADLQARARAIYERTGRMDVAELHDALGQLREVVARHDEDLRYSPEDDDAPPY